MNQSLRLRVLLLMGGLILMLLPLTYRALAEPKLFFSDDFNGPTIDGDNWNTAIATSGIRYMDGVWTSPPADAKYGSVTLADSHLTLDNSSPTFSCPLFPLIWTNKAIPPSGDFELEFRMRYTGGGFWGDGVRIVRMASPFEPTSGSKESAKGDYVLMIHQDNDDCKGPQVSLIGVPGTGSPTLPFNTDWHTYRLRYESEQSTLYVDGKYFAGPLATPRPNCIQLGVGEVGGKADSCGCCGCRWTSYAIDYIRVSVLPTSTRTSSWGELKARYH